MLPTLCLPTAERNDLQELDSHQPVTNRREEGWERKMYRLGVNNRIWAQTAKFEE
jgi:hypothetical protein